jgi:hypothetical protein
VSASQLPIVVERHLPARLVDRYAANLRHGGCTLPGYGTSAAAARRTWICFVAYTRHRKIDQPNCRVHGVIASG